MKKSLILALAALILLTLPSCSSDKENSTETLLSSEKGTVDNNGEQTSNNEEASNESQSEEKNSGSESASDAENASDADSNESANGENSDANSESDNNSAAANNADLKVVDGQKGFYIISSPDQKEDMPYDLQQWLEAQTMPVVIEFTADTWGACISAEQVVGEMAKEYLEKAIFLQIKVDDNPELATKFKLQGVPTFIIMQQSEEKETVLGFDQNKLKSALNSLIS